MTHLHLETHLYKQDTETVIDIALQVTNCLQMVLTALHALRTFVWFQQSTDSSKHLIKVLYHTKNYLVYPN